MEFGWINVLGAIIVILMLIPNIVYAIKNKEETNVASNKVMEKCGFIKEGTVRQGKMVSVYCDYNIYGMLRDDYMSMQGINS